MRVAVIGATGVIGRALVPALAASHEVVAVARHEGVAAPNVRWRVADVTDPAQVGAALDGVDVAVHLVHSLGTPDFEAVDRAAALTVARAAERAGVAPDRLPRRARGRISRALPPPAQPARDGRGAGVHRGPRDDAARRHGRGARERRLRDDPRRSSSACPP